jgi:hypothetical protein
MTTISSGDNILRCLSCRSEDVRRYACDYILFENEEKKRSLNKSS